MRSSSPPWLLLLLACASCQSTPPARTASAVLATEGEDTIWQYLAARYDTDGDGRITSEEYSRGDLPQVDRNGDGVVTAEDFPEPRRGALGISGMPTDQRERYKAVIAARAVVLSYFVDAQDIEAGGLTADGLERNFAALDMDQSRALDEAEFACATDARPWAGPGQAWPMLLAAMDNNQDGWLGHDEMFAYHERMAGEDGVLDAPMGKTAEVSDAFASDGVPAGTPAPDFTLPLLDPQGQTLEGERVTLSDWAYVKPVALIFGSYT